MKSILSFPKPRRSAALLFCLLTLILLLTMGSTLQHAAAAESVTQAIVPQKNTPGTALLSVPRLEPALQAGVTITATKSDALLVDGDGDSVADPGDTLRYTVIVSNTGGTNALGVTVADTIDLNTSLVADSLRVTPLARDDVYGAIGNTPIAITAVDGLLANDLDADDPAPNPAFNDNLTVTGFDDTGTNGNVVVDGDGGFTYNPPAGFEGVDTFTYTIEDAHGLSAEATVTINVSEMVWYVDNNASTGGNGHRQSPYDSLNNSVGGAGDIIFVAEGSGSYATMLTLQDGQKLIGQDFGPDDFATAAGLPPTPGADFPTPGASPTITSSGDAITLSNDNVVRGLTVGDTAIDGMGLVGINFGNLTVRDVVINGTGGILYLENGAVDATFDTLATTFSDTSGVTLINLSGSLSADSGSISDINFVSFDVNGGTATITYGGDIGKSTFGRILRVRNRPSGAGDITFSGNLSCNNGCWGINIATNSGGAILFSGNSKVLSTDDREAVTLNNNSHTTVTFSNGGLDIDTTSGTGFDVTRGGTVNVTGPGNTIDSTTGTALYVHNTTIGSSGLTFESISSDGDANPGIVLDSTGTAGGGLTVTGNGLNTNDGSGGTIQNKDGDGIRLSNTGPVSLGYMNIEANAGNGILATDVEDLTLLRSSLRDNADQASPDEAGLFAINPRGAWRVEHAVFDRSFDDHIRIENSATTSGFTFELLDSTLQDNDASGNGNDALLYMADGGGTNAALTVQRNTFDDSDGDHIQIALDGNASADVTIGGPNATDGNTFTATSGAVLGSGITLSSGQDSLGNNFTGLLTFLIQNNDIQHAGSEAINVNLSTSSVAGLRYSGTIADNTIGASGDSLSGGFGIGVTQNGAGTLDIVVENNEVRQYDGDHGILFEAKEGSGRLNATITNNLVAEPADASVFDGLGINAGASNSDTSTLCADIYSNSLINSAGASGGGADFAIFSANSAPSGTQIILPGYTGGAKDNSAIVAFVRGRNDANPNDPGEQLPAPSGLTSLHANSQGVTGTGSCSSSFALDDLQPTVGEPAVSPDTPEPVAIPVLGRRHTRPYDRESAETRLQAITQPAGTPGDTLSLLGDPFTLAPGEAITLTFDVEIAAALPPDAVSIQNQATISGDNFATVLSVDPDPDPSFPPQNGETITLLDLEADVSIAKTDGPDPAAAGRPLTYTITINNAGPTAARNLTVTDTLPAEFDYVSDSCGGALASGTWTWMTTKIGANDTLPCVITGTVAAGFNGTMTNSATVSALSSDPVPSNNTTTETTTVYDNVFTVDDVALAEGDSGVTLFVFTVSRSNNAMPSSVEVTTTDATAIAGDDYTALPPTTLDFTAGGGLTQTVAVEVHGDAVVELDETFLVSLSDPVNGAIGDGQGVATIENDDSALLTIIDVSQLEGDSGTTVFNFAVTLSEAVDSSLSVDFATDDGTATAPEDYVAASGTLNFSGTAGETKTITISVHGDTLYEEDETFAVTLDNLVASGRDVSLAGIEGLGMILNDDQDETAVYLPFVANDRTPSPLDSISPGTNSGR